MTGERVCKAGELRLQYVRAWLRDHTPEPLYRAYRRRRVERLISSFEPRVVSHRYSGVSLTVRLPDPMAEAWYDRDWPESEEIRFIRERGIFDGALAFDLGAHHAVKALLLAAAGAKVVAVEALPHNVRAAEENLLLNPALASRMTMVTAAVTGRPGPTRIAFELNSRLDGCGDVTVPGVTIDELSVRFGQPDLVYMDIEGGELEALAGARRTLEQQPRWIIEVHGDERPLRAALSGYRVHRLSNDQLFLIAEAS
jgi:FkbM family methyltransferase